jgi:8-oxo-dGTP pyrophosphatase MutT (NUDIX family)
MPQDERSAGVIVFDERVPREYLLLNYGKYWDFPKGHVEVGEDDRATAERELEEETGLLSRSLSWEEGFGHEITYFFRKQSQVVRKQVIFFLARTSSRDVRLSHEHVGFEFLPFEAAMQKLKYPTAREVLLAAETFLETKGK